MRSGEKVYGLFNDSFPPVLDGVTLTVQNYVKKLVESRRKTCVVTPWNPVQEPYDGFLLYRYFSLPIFSRHPYRYGYPKLDPFIWRNLNRTPFALVHAHCPFSSGRLALHVARKQHVPLVATFHSKYKTDLEHSLPSWMVRRVMRRIMSFFEAADHVWIPQQRVEDTVREYGYRGKLTVVENGIDFSMSSFADTSAYKVEARKRLGLAPDEMVLLFVGQHIKEKGVEIIINAVDRLRDLPVKMLFVGTGYAVDEMNSMIKQLGLSGRVKLYGVIGSRQRLMDFYAAAHLFLFPSFYDNAPLVVREAAVMGTPSILLRGSTAAEVIADGFNGFLAENTPESYADIVRRLFADKDCIMRVGRNASATLARPWSDIMDDVMQRYQYIIESYGRR